MATQICECRCHNTARADYESARHFTIWYATMNAAADPTINAIIAVRGDDVLHAATAAGCPCIPNHCEALRKTALPFMHDLDPHAWEDPGIPQADGDSDDEG